MPETRPATLTPSHREFLPPWMARQPWYRGTAVPTVRLIGGFRLQDPAGAVGIDTHLVSDGACLYQIPMTYRDAPLGTVTPIATAEHSLLGTRWIYDATHDPVWTAEVLRLVRTAGVTDRDDAAGGAAASGHPVGGTAWLDDQVSIDLRRVLGPGEPDGPAGVVGHVLGTWRPDPQGPPVTGCLATVLTTASRQAG